MNQTIEQKVLELIEGATNQLGFEIVSVKLRNTDTLEVLIDRLDDQKVTINDCALVSKNISAILDVENILGDQCHLEVSSAGIERPLTKFSNYIKFEGRSVKLKLKTLLNGIKNYQGIIVGAKDDEIFLKVDDKEIIIPFELVSKARLVFTDDLFKKLLNKLPENTNMLDSSSNHNEQFESDLKVDEKANRSRTYKKSKN